MKKIFFFALMLGAALSFTACGGDDDGGDNNSELKTPPYDGYAAVHTLNSSKASTDGSIYIDDLEVLPNGYMKIGGKVPEEVLSKPYGPHKKSAMVKRYWLVPFKKSADDVFTLNGKEWKGQIEFVQTKGGADEQVIFDLTFDGTHSFSGAAYAMAQTTPFMAATVQFANLCRTFTIDKTHIELKFPDKDTPVWKDFNGCNWPAIKQWANDNDANITTEDEGFDKTITTISFSKFGSFTIGYSDGTCDDATWQSVGSSLENLSFKWKDGDMGNKFLENGHIKVTSSGTKYNFTAESDVISGNKNYHVTLQFRTTAQ